MSAIPDCCIHEIFERRSAQNPAARALVRANEALSYGELNRLADILAARLAKLGVRQRDNVALLFDRSFELFIAMLAVLKRGAAYVPLDSRNPFTRNAHCLDSAGVKLILCDCDCSTLCNETRTSLRVIARELEGERETVPTDALSTEAPAYVMFTSGTTSQPKGVVVPHRAVTRLVINTNYIQIAPDDAILQLSVVSFDASTFEIWGALLNGATLVLYSGAVLDPNLFRRHIVEHNITILWLTAALFHLFAARYVEALRPLKILLAGGDVLHAPAVRAVLNQISHIKLINGYGPTENTTFTCCHVMSRDNKPEVSVPIGQPIAGTEVLILDENRAPVASGEVGELYAAGRGVALGYLNTNSEESPFIRDVRLAPGLIYRTGDLVRVNAQGLVEFIGRKDNQVKLRGYRLCLEEIKAHLVEIPWVSEAALRCEELADGDQLLVAYLQTHAQHQLDPRAVRNYLEERVPAYMIPDRILIGTALPFTPNGKVDSRKIFSVPGKEEKSVKSDAIRDVIVPLFREKDNFKNIDLDEDYFDRGVSSLTVVGLQIKVEERLGVSIETADVMRLSTINQWVEAYAAKSRAVSAGESP